MQGFVSPGFRHAYWVCFQFSNLLFAALDVFLRILRSSPVYKNHYTNSQILFPSGTHKLVLNEFLSTLWCFLGKQIVYPFCFVARWLGTDLFSSLRGICVVSHLLIIISKVLILELTDNATCNSLRSPDFCYYAWFIKFPTGSCLERLR